MMILSNRQRHPLPSRAVRRRHRGSVLLIVLALLSLLVLLAATLAYTSKIELISSRNFGKGIQNQTAVMTGVPFAALAANATLPEGAVGTLDLTIDASSSEVVSASGKAAQQATGDSKRTASQKQGSAVTWSLNRGGRGVQTQTASVDVTDMSSRVNLNTADAGQLARVIGAAAAQGNVSADAGALAQRIVDWRYGPDGAPGTAGEDDNQSAKFSLSEGKKDDETAVGYVVGTSLDESPTAEARLNDACDGNAGARKNFIKVLQDGIDDPEEYVADIRYPAFGDDRRFSDVAGLLEVQGFTPRLIAALEPFVTPFSLSFEQRPVVDGTAQPLVDLNRATAEEIYEALALEYAGAKADLLLRQFAVNIVDARDQDRHPSTMSDGSMLGKVIGVERTPVLNEVYPDSITDDKAGDDGQFIEIFNPWQEAFSLTGWRVRVGSRDYPLSGQMTPGGYLVVTDDYDNSTDSGAEDDLAGQGSFYDVFRSVSNNSSKRVLETSEFNLPHEQGTFTVELLDQGGALVDRFVYTVREANSTLNSYQRHNPIVREAAYQRATPFSRPVDPQEPMPALNVSERVRNTPQDVPFTSVLELFDVFAGYAQADGRKGTRWAYPAMASPASTSTAGKELAADANLIDARIVDLFTIELSDRMTREEVAKEYRKHGKDEKLERAPDAWAGELGDAPQDLPGKAKPGTDAYNDLERVQAVAWARFAMPPKGLRHGLVNVNTAGEVVLESAGLTPSQATSIATRRRDIERDAIAGKSSRTVLYGRLSDLLVDEYLWGSGDSDTCQRVSQIAPAFDRLTVSSRAFLLEGQALEPSESPVLQKSGTRMMAIVAMDKPAPEYVSWGLTP